MDRRHSCVLLLVLLFACMQIPGCGSGTMALSVVTTSLPNGTVGVAYSGSLIATGGTAPYTWSQTSGGAMPGGVTLGSNGNFVGTPTTAGTFGPYVFKVTDSDSNVASSMSLSIAISGATLTVTTASLPSGTVGMTYSATLQASGGTPPYTWSQTSGGSLPAGIQPVTSGGAISGTPTTAGSYGPYVFTVADSKNATATSVNLMISISSSAAAACRPLGNEAALTSANPYAFLVKGTDRTGEPINIAGSFTPNGSGGIANAAVDYNSFSNGPEQLRVDLAASSYAFGTSAQGCLYLSFSGLVTADVAAKQSETARRTTPAAKADSKNLSRPATAGSVVPSVRFSFYLSGFDGTIYHTGSIIESDNATTGTKTSGFLHVQTPSSFVLSVLPSNFAFGVDGWTPQTSTPLRTAMAGAFANSAGTLSSGSVDLNTGGTPSGEGYGGSGSLGTIDTSSGRGQGSIFVTTFMGPLTYDFVFYTINASDIILLSADLPDSSDSPFLSGRAMASNASYPSGALNGYYLLASQGLDVSSGVGANQAEVGTLNATSASTIPTATIYSNDAGSYTSTAYPNSSYTLEASTGRVSFTAVTQTPPVVYLTAAGSDDGIAGFLVGTDTIASSGVLVTQSTSQPSFVLSSISGNYASNTAEDVDGQNGTFLGEFSFNGTGGYTLTSQVIGKLTNYPSADTISINPDGSGSLDGGKFPFVTNGTSIFAIPDSGDPLLFVFTQGTLAN